MNINIVDYGAIADKMTLNTNCIQKAIDDCNAAGGGTVIVPSGIFVTGTLWIKSNVELHIEHGGILRATEKLEEYNNTEDYPQNFDNITEGWCGKHLIIALQQSNVAISGNGTIEGCGDLFYGGERHFGSNYVWSRGYYEIENGAPLRPGQLLCFVECDNISVRNITVTNSSCWNLFFYGCDYVQADNLKIFNDKQHANSDGIDIDCCSFVTVSNCIINTGDDCIAIRGSNARLSNPNKTCEYITISNCVLSNSTCAVRLGVGTGKIKHVSISDIIIAESGEGLTFMTGWNGRGHVEISDISFENIIGDEVGYPIQVYAKEAEVKRVSISNYRCHCKSRIKILGAPGMISDFILRNVEIYDKAHTPEYPENALVERGAAIAEICCVNRLSLDNVKIFALDNYFDNRTEIISITDCQLSKKHVKLVYKNEEKDL